MCEEKRSQICLVNERIDKTKQYLPPTIRYEIILVNDWNKMRVLGLMSGTSMDGLDCGLFEIYLTSDYQLNWNCIDFQTAPYSVDIRESISNALEGNKGVVMDADRILGQEFYAISKEFINGRKIDLITSHGQTISHDDGVSTRQIGNPQYLQKIFQVPLVFNFRQADIDAGGNGAPLMPFLDWLLFKDSGRDTITLNLGGVANVAFIPKSGKRGEVMGFDTGPGMALIDECCQYFYEEKIDRDGERAKRGQVNEEILTELMANDFIQKKPPKSTGRHEFGRELVFKLIQRFSQCSPNDIIRTFCAFTAKSIAENLNKFLNFNILDIGMIISGGGVHHPLMMENIRKYTGISNFKISDEYGIQSDMKEALLMAVLGVARIQAMTANMSSVTGARELVVLGNVLD